MAAPTFFSTHPASMNILQRAWSHYLDLLDTRPLITKSVSAGVIGGIGDVATSRHRGFVWDKERTLRLSLYGLLFAAPITHGWYKILERRLGTGMDVKTAMSKVAADQVLAAAPLTALFFAVNSAAEGKGREEIEQRVRQNLWPTMKANWAVWPAALTFNFWLVPLNLRVLVVNVLGLGWGTYLSYVQHKHAGHVPTKLPDPFPTDNVVPGPYPPGAIQEEDN